MFFIAGIERRATTLGQGIFYCPTCDQERSYEHKVVKKSATFFFIPVMGLGELGRYIECQYCGETFREEVLDYRSDPSADEVEAEFRKAVKYVIVAMSLSDGEMVRSEIQAISSITQELTGHPMTDEELNNLVDQVKKDDNTIVEHLESVALFLNETGKDLVIKALLHVGAADERFDKRELVMIAKASDALNISNAHLKGIIEEFNESQPTIKLQ